MSNGLLLHCAWTIYCDNESTSRSKSEYCEVGWEESDGSSYILLKRASRVHLNPTSGIRLRTALALALGLSRERDEGVGMRE